MKEKEQKNEIAISVKNVSKQFVIPHEKVSTLKGFFVNIFHKKSFETFNALEDVSFEIKKGEFFGIIGRNGSGKSTLLKIISGIYTPNTGKIEINGMISPFLELGIGFNPELSGRDNIYLNGTVLGLTEEEINKKFNSIVAFSELERFIDQKLKNYSSGMQVRLAFSVSIHANRDILIMDEVLAVGDTNFQSKCLSEFSKYRDMGKTVIIVTHDINIVQRYCDRAMLLRNGKIEKIGNPEEVGNEYIYQNMSDEEKRIVDEQKKKTPLASSHLPLAGEKKEPASAQGSSEVKQEKIVEITNVEFIDKDGKTKNVFETGEDMSIRVYFKQNKKVNILNFSLTIHNSENNYFFGINSFIDKININKYIKNNYFQIDYFKIPLKNGTYNIKAGIFGENELKNYDFFKKNIQFVSRGKSHGTIELDYKWN